MIGGGGRSWQPEYMGLIESIGDPASQVARCRFPRASRSSRRFTPTTYADGPIRSSRAGGDESPDTDRRFTVGRRAGFVRWRDGRRTGPVGERT